MEEDFYFTTAKPVDKFLSTIVDYYFYVDQSISQLSANAEFIIPFPRITFGYFFNHPFTATNLTLNTSVSVNMVISKISTDQIVVQPQTERIKIVGAHVCPFCLAYLTRKSIRSLPWLTKTDELFPEAANKFRQRVDQCTDPQKMFEEVERVFLDSLIKRDLSLITEAVRLIELNAGSIGVTQLCRQLSISERTLRNQFYQCIGCSPKEFIRLVKMRQVAFQMKHSKTSLTNIAYDNAYFDQAHFIHEVRSLTNQSPNELRNEIPNFRFLQF